LKYDAAIFHPEILETAFSVYRVKRLKFFLWGGQMLLSPIAQDRGGGEGVSPLIRKFAKIKKEK